MFFLIEMCRVCSTLSSHCTCVRGKRVGTLSSLCPALAEELITLTTNLPFRLKTYKYLMRILLPFLLLIALLPLNAQTEADKEKALELGRKAIELMDNGKYNESLLLLAEAEALDPESPIYPYEACYAYYLAKDYKSALKLGKKTIKSGRVTPQLYSMMGNINDDMGQPKKAIKYYEQGIERYPESPIYYVELGILKSRQGELDAAAAYWEKGIEVAPTYPSNYFHLASLFARTDQHIWTVLYAEMFLNLEPATARSEAVAQHLYDGFQNAIQLEGDTAKVSFLKEMTISMNDLTSFKLPAPMVFGTDMLAGTTAVTGATDLNCTSLHKIRKEFLHFWYSNEHNEEYLNPVVERMKAIADAGHLEAYDHFLFRTGDPVGWEFWANEHKAEFDAFVEWFNANPAELSPGEGITRSTFR